MTTKKKLIIAITSLSVALLAVIGIVIGVLAARNQAVSNNFSVTYEANNVSATVGAKFKIGESGEDQFFTGGNTYYDSSDEYNPIGQYSAQRFVPADGENNDVTLAMPKDQNNDPINIELSVENQYVIFTYYFTNNASIGGRYLTVELDRAIVPDNSTNLNLYYFPSNYGAETYEKIVNLDSSTYKFTSYSALTHKTMYVAPGQTMYMYFIAEIDDLTVSTGTINSNQYSFVLGTTTEADVPSGWTTFYNGGISGVWGLSSSNTFYETQYLRYNLNTDVNDSNNKWVSVTRNPSVETYDIPSEITIEDTVMIGGQNYYVTEIEDYAFENCTNLETVHLPVNLTAIGSGAFHNTGIVDIYTNSNLNNSAFVKNMNIEEEEGPKQTVSTAFPTTLTTIGGYAFGNTNLTSVTIPSTIINLGYGIFSGCNSLTTAVFQSGCTEVESGMFSYCNNLTSVTLPSSVTTIEGDAFQYSGITSIDLSYIQTVGDRAFESSHLTSVTIPAGLTSIGDDAFSKCQSLTSFTVASNNSAYKDVDGVLYSGDGKTLINYPLNSDATSYTVLSGTTTISNHAFRMATSLTEIILPNSLTEIGQEAFNHCTSLTAITIPAGVTSVGGFNYCTSLASVTMLGNVTHIYSEAFPNCTSLTSIELPSTVEYISSSAFRGSGLTSITIPASVTYIGQYAFGDCTNLTTVTFAAGSELNNLYEGAFYNSGITSISIPSGVTAIHSDTFKNCENLTHVTILGDITEIGDYAFFGSGITSFDIYDTVTYIGENALRTRSLAAVTINSSSIYGAATGTMSSDLGGALRFATTVRVLKSADNGSNTYLTDTNKYSVASGTDLYANYYVYTKVAGGVYSQTLTPFAQGDLFTAIQFNTELTDAEVLDLITNSSFNHTSYGDAISVYEIDSFGLFIHEYESENNSYIKMNTSKYEGSEGVFENGSWLNVSGELYNTATIWDATNKILYFDTHIPYVVRSCDPSLNGILFGKVATNESVLMIAFDLSSSNKQNTVVCDHTKSLSQINTILGTFDSNLFSTYDVNGSLFDGASYLTLIEGKDGVGNITLFYGNLFGATNIYVIAREYGNDKPIVYNSDILYASKEYTFTNEFGEARLYNPGWQLNNFYYNQLDNAYCFYFGEPTQLGQSSELWNGIILGTEYVTPLTRFDTYTNGSLSNIQFNAKMTEQQINSLLSSVSVETGYSANILTCNLSGNDTGLLTVHKYGNGQFTLSLLDQILLYSTFTDGSLDLKAGWIDSFTDTSLGVTVTWDNSNRVLSVSGANPTYVSSVQGFNGEFFGVYFAPQVNPSEPEVERYVGIAPFEVGDKSSEYILDTTLTTGEVTSILEGLDWTNAPTLSGTQGPLDGCQYITLITADNANYSLTVYYGNPFGTGNLYAIFVGNSQTPIFLSDEVNMGGTDYVGWMVYGNTLSAETTVTITALASNSASWNGVIVGKATPLEAFTAGDDATEVAFNSDITVLQAKTLFGRYTYESFEFNDIQGLYKSTDDLAIANVSPSNYDLLTIYRLNGEYVVTLFDNITNWIYSTVTLNDFGITAGYNPTDFTIQAMGVTWDATNYMVIFSGIEPTIVSVDKFVNGNFMGKVPNKFYEGDVLTSSDYFYFDTNAYSDQYLTATFAALDSYYVYNSQFNMSFFEILSTGSTDAYINIFKVEEGNDTVYGIMSNNTNQTAIVWSSAALQTYGVSSAGWQTSNLDANSAMQIGSSEASYTITDIMGNGSFRWNGTLVRKTNSNPSN